MHYRTCLMAVLAVTALGMVAAAPAEPPAKAAAPVVRLMLDLDDGSHITGEPATEDVGVRTGLGEIQIKWKQIVAIEWGADRVAKLDLCSGDKVSGQMTAENLQVKALFGQIVIPVARLKRVVVADGAAFGLQFDGKQNYVEVRHDPSLDPKDAMTLECRFRTTSAEPRAMVGKREWSTVPDCGYQLHIDGGNLYGYWGGTALSGGRIDDGLWHHAALTWDGKTRRLFLDGVKQSEDEPGPWPVGNAPFRIGGISGLLPRDFFEGTISHVRLSKVDRYKGQNFKPQAVLAADKDTVACWNFSEGEGAAVHDVSGNGHDGKLVGDPPPQWGEATPMPAAPPPAKRPHRVPGELFPSVPPNE